MQSLRVASNGAGALAWAWEIQDSSYRRQAVVYAPGWADAQPLDGLETRGVQDLDVDSSGRIVATILGVAPPALYVERWNGTAWETMFDELTFSATPGNGPYGKLAFDQNGRPFLVVQDRTRDRGTIHVLTLQNY
jgi:hypothetical protein